MTESRNSRSESMSAAPMGAKLAMFKDMGSAKAPPEIVKPEARIKATVSAVGVAKCLTTRHEVKPGRGRRFDKNADGLPAQRSLADLP